MKEDVSFFITNISSKNIMLSDLPNIPLIKPGVHMDLSLYASEDKLNSSKQLSYILEKGWLEKSKCQQVRLQEPGIDPEIDKDEETQKDVIPEEDEVDVEEIEGKLNYLIEICFKNTEQLDYLESRIDSVIEHLYKFKKNNGNLNLESISAGCNKVISDYFEKLEDLK